MRVAFLTPHLKVNGGNRILLSLAAEMVSLNHDITVIALMPSIKKLIFKIIFERRIPWFEQYTGKLKYAVDLKENSLDDFDYIITGSAEIASKLLGFENVPKSKVIFYVMHDEKLYHHDPALVAAVCSSSIKKIALSTWVKEVLEEYGNQGVETIIAPVDVKQFHPVSVVKEKDEVRVMLLHHVYDWKGTKEGAEIVERLKKRHSNIRLVLFGVRAEVPIEPHDEYYYDISQDKLAELYSRADIFLCPSWDEGLGMPGMEAMACGAALVTYDTGGSRDYAFDGDTAFVAPRRDINALEMKLEQAVIDIVLREKIAKQGYEYIINLPSWKDQAEKLLKILQTK